MLVYIQHMFLEITQSVGGRGRHVTKDRVWVQNSEVAAPPAAKWHYEIKTFEKLAGAFHYETNVACRLTKQHQCTTYFSPFMILYHNIMS